MNTHIRTLIAFLVLAGCGPSDPCLGGGTATLRVRLVSTIAGAKGLLTGPDGTVREAVSTDSTSIVELTGVPSGRWSATGERYATPDSRVRTAYTADSSAFCAGAGETYDVTVTWSAIPTSGKLWALNGSGGSGALLAFEANDLRASTTASAVSSGIGPFGRDVTFDRDGNVWTHGATTADAMIIMTEAAHLTGDGRKTADRSINIEGVRCLPAATGLAFDRAGNLWVSSGCMNAVYRLTPSQLAASGDVVPAVTLSGLDAPHGLAFDAAGNLYVADSGLARLLRYDAASLSSPAPVPSARIASLRTDNPMDSSVLAPSWLAFDADGNLWANDFGPNVIFFVRASDLAGAGERTVTPGVRITLGVSALLEGMAFDEAGGLWVAFSAGKLARLDASQLMTSSGPGAPTAPQTVLSSADMGYASNLAFYPAPAALPLAHAMR